MIIHNVYFWLINPNSEIIAEFMADLQKLEKIKEIKQLHIGVPAPIIRPVVDHSYSVGMYVIFMDLIAHDGYQVHPLHKEFLSKNKEKWSKVQIYDVHV